MLLALLFMSIAANAQKVAILPINYIGDSPIMMDDMRYRLQNIAYQYLRNGSMELRIQDPSETNALLLRNGVRESNLREFTPAELADMLHVEYVLTGMVTQEVVGMSTTNNSRRSEYNNRRWNERESWRHSRTVTDMNTTIDLSIYNYQGENIYSRSRRSILSTADAYKYGMEYLLKRSPLYHR